MFTRILNRGKDLLFAGPFLDAYWLKKLYGKTISFCYHRVDDPERFPFLAQGGVPVMTPEELGRDIRFLKSKGFAFVTFEDLAKNEKPDLSRPSCIVTFDDGFLDNYTQGLEVLEKFGVRAVFFQTTAMVDASDLVMEHALIWYLRDPESSEAFTRLAHEMFGDEPEVLSRRGFELAFFLTEAFPASKTEKLLEAAKSRFKTAGPLKEIAAQIYPRAEHLKKALDLGHEIGSHGAHHLKRSTIDEARFERELAESSRRLTEILGTPPATFAYPHGDYGKSDEAVCSRFFSRAVTVEHGWVDPKTKPFYTPRHSWPGKAKNRWRRKRWLFTGAV